MPARSPAFWWGILGVALLLAWALVRLIPLALHPILEGQLTAVQITLLIGWTLFMAFAEGYRGFQQGFSPRVVARALSLSDEQRWHRVLSAPLICMGLIDAPRRRKIVSWCLLIGITLLVIIVKTLPQPWRGMIDFGVVVGLSWGLAALFWYLARALRGHDVVVPADLRRRS